jgi:NSS family neurotransmitter:Na+ symporter
MEKQHTKRSSFSGGLGYVMAVAGSAVGLGNIWRFPYLAAKYGGGAFLITYIILAVTFGFTLLISETALGRMTGKSPIGAFRAVGAKKLMFGGWLNAIIPMIITPYYCVIGGWVIKYLVGYIAGQTMQLSTDNYFSAFTQSPAEPIFYLVLFAVLTFIVVLFGVEKGIERVSRLLMPLLVAMAIAISIYSITRPGAMEGVKYYLIPNFSNFSLMTVVAAMGQLFFSLSIAMGILYTYGSYMKKEVNMERSIGQVEIMDTVVAFLAGLMIIPSVFAFSGGSQESLSAGPSLMFITMPKVFSSMGLGGLIGAAFFLLVFFAALTSSISLMEACVSTIQDQTKWSRGKCSVAMLIETIVIGLPCSLGFGLWDFIQPLGMSILDFLDFLSNSVLMPIAAICTCLLVLKVTGLKAIIDEVKLSSPFRREKAYVFCAKYITIAGLLIILISSVLSALGLITM